MKVLRPIRVNIFDLLEYHKAYERCQGQVVNLVPLRKFATVKALAEYSMDNDYEKVYPRKQAKKQGALKFMLRKLFRA